MARNSTQAFVVSGWRKLLSAWRTNAGDLEHLEVSHAALEALLAELEQITTQQGQHNAGKQLAAKHSQQLLADGSKLATLLRVGLKQRYGNRNEKLVEFGIRPLRRTRKAKEEEPPATEAGTPAAPEPAPTTPPAVKP
jgi:hypothetical protein